MEDCLEIGVVVNTHGVKGYVKIIPCTFDPKRFELLSEVTLLEKSLKKIYQIEKIKFHKQFVLIKFRGIEDMDQAESLKGSLVLIPKSSALHLGEDEYYIGDIIGCNVVTSTGEILGEVTEVLFTGANDVYTVKSADGGEILIPAVKHYILNVDILSKKILVDLPEGLR